MDRRLDYYPPEHSSQISLKTFAADDSPVQGNSLNWSDISLASWRSWVGCVPQSIKIFNGTLLDNICLGNSLEEGEAIIQFCQESGFHE